MKHLVIFIFTLLAPTLGWAATNSNRICWDPNTETDLAGYKLHIGTTAGVYPNMKDVAKTATPDAPCVSIGSLALTDATYFVVATAYDTSGNTSGFSNEVMFMLDNAPPAIPGNLRIQ